MSSPHLLRFFTFPICFKCRTTEERLTLSSSATSRVVVRGLAAMILSISHCQLPMAGHCTPHLKALISLAKLLDPPLQCTFISSSWAKCVVDVASCLCRFTTHFELELKKKSFKFVFCLTSVLLSKINIKHTASNVIRRKT